jgi:GNAT superfamily N-acetyltransferase
MSVNLSDLVSYRSGETPDTGFIYSTWLRGLRYGNSWFAETDREAYYKAYHKFIEDILARPAVFVTVACLKDDPETILGYSVHSSDKLHWVHVKKNWRGIGIAKSLIPDTVKSVTHLTTTGLSIVRKRGNLKFDPFNIE